VDQEDPFFTTPIDPADPNRVGFTKRPVLLDPVDWVDGWPTVNGGAGPSDAEMPAPAAQEGQVSRHETRLVEPQVIGRQIRADEFDRTRLRGGWDWVREDAADYSVAGGVLRFEVQQADLFVDSDTASVLVRNAPDRDYVVETRVRVDVPNEGCCFNFAQAGLVVYGDDDNFIKLVNASIFETRQTEFAKELAPVPTPQYSRYGNTVVGPPSEHPGWTWLRIAVEHLDTEQEQAAAGGDTERYTSYTSQDGVRWVRGGVWTHSLDNARIGLVSMAAPAPDTYTAEFDYVRISRLREGAVS
jgi:arabinan endo-1,5-alpha-L-arabinosidase